jgi:hypothetical protein
MKTSTENLTKLWLNSFPTKQRSDKRIQVFSSIVVHVCMTVNMYNASLQVNVELFLSMP